MFALRSRLADRLLSTIALISALIASAAANSSAPELKPAALTTPEFAAELAEFRAQRELGLRSPDGWLALVGLHWIEPGRHRIGSDADANVTLAVGPAILGEIERVAADSESHALSLHVPTQAGLKLDGIELKPGSHRLLSDRSETPSRLEFAGGSLSLIERGDRIGLRVRSDTAPALISFKGLNWFEPAPALQLEARFEPHPPGQTLPIVNVLGQVDDTPNPGRLEFKIDGTAYSLEALGDPADALFLIFADRSNGRESYGAGRFLYTGPVVDGRVRLDFNRAINPPCAYTDYSTCPLPPPENRLPVLIRAGEARFGHSTPKAAS
jgi:uncharacterized protein (DUF1684 family)